MNAELHKKYSRMSTKDLQNKITKVDASDEAVIAEILANRANKTSVEVIQEATIPKKTAGKKKLVAKGTAPKKVTPAKKETTKAPTKKAATPAKKEKTPAAPKAKKKSEKIGETKSDKIRVMLKKGMSSGEIIAAFAKEGIQARYPEVRRNRIWLEENENWKAPEAK